MPSCRGGPGEAIARGSALDVALERTGFVPRLRDLFLEPDRIEGLGPRDVPEERSPFDLWLLARVETLQRTRVSHRRALRPPAES